MNKSIENIIGENIRRLRAEKDMKQNVLADELNIRRQTISAYERGITLPDIYSLIRIADYFGISLDELTGRTANADTHVRSCCSHSCKKEVSDPL